VRRALRPAIAAVLIAVGALGAVPVALLGAWMGTQDHGPQWWAGPLVVGCVLALDAVFLGTGELRPPAVNQQVPRSWGHERGPWWASARYAPRLAVGPGTILGSWAWWGMLVAGGLAGWQWSVGVSMLYVVVRALSTVLVGAGVRDGVAMAARLRKVAALERPTRIVSAVALTAGLVAAVVAR
jgi:hypothetical protein